MLCVDSDPQRLNQIQQDLILLNNNMEILEATTLQKALQLIVQNSDEIAIVLATENINDNLEWIENERYFSILENPTNWLNLVFNINGPKIS